MNKVKNKSHMILLIDVEKVFDKLQKPFMIKTWSKLGEEGISLSTMYDTGGKCQIHFR